MSIEHDERFRVPIPAPVKESMRDLGCTIEAVLPSGWGFALLIFEFGPAGAIAYVSNAERDTMIDAMQEFIAKRRPA